MPNKILKIKNLTKTYKGKNLTINALKGISLDIFEGEILGLLGANGAGKTTLSSILVTLHPPTSGEILYFDKSIYDDLSSYKGKIGFCPQRPNLIKDLDVERNLYYAGKFFGMEDDEVWPRVEELLKKYDLKKYAKEKVDILSGGYRQRVLIVRALVHNPKIIIFDEPTVGLDPHIRHQLWETIRDLKKQNITVILTTHYLDEAELLSDRVCILDKGLVKHIDTPENLKNIYQKSKLEDVFLKIIHED